MNERDLLCAYKIASQRLNDVSEAKKDAQACYDKAEAELVEFLTGNQAEATATYDGLGYAKMSKPRVYASFLKENEEKAKLFLKESGRGDMVKETVAAPSLSSYVAELIEAGKPVPEIFSYYLKTKVRMYE